MNPAADGTEFEQLALCRRELDEARRELADRTRTLEARVAENADLVERLRLTLDELSTPVLEVWDDVLALPIVGVIDTQRSVKMTERVLAEVVERRSKYVIVDLTGVDVVDTSTADRLIRLARGVVLLGARCIVCGVRPVVAQTLVELGVELTGLTTERNLKRALDTCISESRRSHVEPS